MFSEHIKNNPEAVKILLIIIGSFFVFSSVFLSSERVTGYFTQSGPVHSIFITTGINIVRVIIFCLGIIFLANKFYYNRLPLLSAYKKEFLLMCFTFIFCLSMIEISSSYIIKYGFTHLAMRGKDINYAPLEYTMTGQFNIYGFRDSDINFTKDYKIAVVGDSFVFGSGVEENETFSHLLRDNLSTGNVSIGVYNIGFPGTFPEDYLETLNEMAPIIKPNMIILGYFFGNDITCKKDEFHRTFIFPYTQQLLGKIFINEQNRFLAENIGKINRQITENERIGYHNTSELFFSENITEGYFRTVTMFDNCPLSKKEILDIRDFAENKNSTLIIVMIPIRQQVSNASRYMLKYIGYTFDDTLLTDRTLQDSFLLFCHENQITCLDLLPYLQKSEKEPYYLLDSHFNTVGHEITAGVLLRYLNKI